jgi:hypothetical protein
VAIGIAISGAAVTTPQALQQRSVRWPAGAVISVWIDTRNSVPDVESLVSRALTTWTHAAAGRFALQRARDANSAVVHIRFADADGIYGETSPHIDRRTGTIDAAEVVIAATVAGDSLRQRVVIYLTALHELGHALGLPHTNSFDDIMYAFRRPDDGERYFGAFQRRLGSADDIGTPRATGLSPADTFALQALYDR